MEAASSVLCVAVSHPCVAAGFLGQTTRFLGSLLTAAAQRWLNTTSPIYPSLGQDSPYWMLAVAMDVTVGFIFPVVSKLRLWSPSLLLGTKDRMPSPASVSPGFNTCRELGGGQEVGGGWLHPSMTSF